MTALIIAALVKRGHGLIGRSRLNLEEIGALMSARVTVDRRRVDILPRGRAAHHVIDVLELAVLAVGDLSVDVVYERAGVACETVAVGTFLDDQHVATCWAKKEHLTKIKALCKMKG